LRRGSLRPEKLENLVFLIIPIAFNFLEIVFYPAERRAHVMENGMRIGKKRRCRFRSVLIRALFGQNHLATRRSSSRAGWSVGDAISCAHQRFGGEVGLAERMVGGGEMYLCVELT
jgi:hypothetical protein